MEKLFQKKKKSQCKNCELRKHVDTWYIPTQVISEGKPVRAMLVGEAPGRTEDQLGLPFVGESGRLLRDCVIRALGSEDGIVYSNTVKCRPVDGKYNRAPKMHEVERCLPYLFQDIEQLQPKVIVCLGRIALNGLIGVEDPIKKTRGKFFDLELAGRKYKVLSVYHPAYVLRNRAKLTERFVNDLIKAALDRNIGFKKPKHELLMTRNEVKEFIDHCLYEMDDQGIGLGLDTESRNVNKRYKNKVLTFQFATPVRSAVIPIRHPESPFNNKKDYNWVRKQIKRLFTTKNPKFCRVLMHHAQFDLARLRSIGVLVRNAPVVCTQQAMHLLDENRIRQKDLYDGGPYKLDTLAEELLGEEKYEDPEIKKNISSLHKVPLVKVAKYGASDAWLCVALFRKYMEMAKREKFTAFTKLCDELSARTSVALMSVEWSGFQIDMNALSILVDPKKSPVKQRIKEISENLIKGLPSVQRVNKRLSNEISGGMQALFYEPWVFSFRKREHIASLFFGEMELEGLKGEYVPEAKKFPAMDSAFKGHYGDMTFLESESPKLVEPWSIEAPKEKDDDKSDTRYYTHPEVALFKEWADLKSMDEKFLTKTWNMMSPKLATYRIDHKDGRLRASYSNTSTVTGRNSSFDPNNQQIPRADTPVKKLVKDMYISPEGRWLIQLDFKGAEVRWWAICSKDPYLLKIFRESLAIYEEYKRSSTNELYDRMSLVADVHKQTASLFFNVPLDEVTKGLRQQTKSLVFARIYGQSVKSFAERLGISYEAAQALADEFDLKFKVGVKYLRKLERMAQRYGFSESLIGRRRRLGHLYESGEDKLIAQANRLAVNSPIQSIASDANNMAAADLFWHIQNEKTGWEIHNLVHDSCVLSLPLGKGVNYLFDSLKKIEWFFTDGLVKRLEDSFDLEVPVGVEVDLELGFKWGTLVKWKYTKEHLREICEHFGVSA